ncbi:glucose 1-dehydrogenase [Actinoplanes bogorensis]|uniref:Glucose 1-dehydrogenase n=1 Tax=Paractinoplanes bogorensis TaxID=1610840 RepID=A0ABS5YSY5_9ACTN|nr:glucose 1-dehydrogenase [Actinoplanes bogorensis]MBU2666186.1 glucose 1-dehydrogenase [Actinoplanes bogorensis]
MRLSGKIAVVTGASRSIGKAIALGYAAEGASVVVGYRSDSAAAESVVKQIEDAGGQALAVQGDTSRSADVEHLMDATLERFGQIDILVNNAAVLKRTPFLEITEDEWDEIMSVNLKGYFLCAQAAAKRMVPRKSGVIINMSSASEQLAGINLAHYCSAKGGVRLLTRQLALELAPHGIRANSIAPGLIETDLNRHDIADPAFREYRLGMIPLQIIGVPEDVVGAAVFLACDESRLATGSTLFLDAGQTIA